MASQPNKVRLVRCPKCLKLIPEVASLPVYKCGGCGTTLEVKRRKEHQEGESSAQKNKLQHDSGDKGSTCSSQKATPCSSDGSEQVEDPEFSEEKPITRKISNRIASSCELDRSEKEESSSVAGGSIKLNGNHEMESDSERQSPDNRRQVSGGGNFTPVSQEPSNEGFPSKDKTSSIGKELDESEIIVRRYANLIGSRNVVKIAEVDVEHIMSEDDMVGVSKPPATAEATDGSIISEDDGNSEPPAAKSNHAYDASVSSIDGWSDQVSENHSRQSKRSFFGSERVMEFASTSEGAARQDVSENNRIAVRPDLQNHQDSDQHSLESKRSLLESERARGEVNTSRGATKENFAESIQIAAKSGWENEVRKLSLISVVQKQDPVTVRSVSLDQDKLRGNARDGIPGQKHVRSHDTTVSHDTTSFNPVQSWLGLKGEELKIKQLLAQTEPSRGYENNAPSKYRHDLLRLSLYPPENLESVERNQMELLRKVDELSDQLNRSYAHSGKTHERFPNRENQPERQQPLYYNHNLADQNAQQRYDATFPRPSPGAYRSSKSMPFRCDYSQIPLSRNGRSCRHQSNCSCYKEDWERSQQLPPPSPCFTGGQCMEYPGHVCLYSPRSSSPEQHLYARYPLDVGALPSEQILRDHNVENLQRRRRRQSVKRFCRPIAGGAPFIVCYSCRNLLHLPADSVLSSKRSHRLQCGSCSKVLVFSLHRRTHIRNAAAVSPAGEVDSGGASTSKRNSASTSHANDDALGDLSSYTEDNGLSICRSLSTEGDAACVTTEVSVAQSKSVDRTHPLSRRTKPKGETRNGKHGDKLKHPILVSSDSDDLSGDEEMEKAKGSPLHRLLGYSSPLRLLYNSDS